MRGASPPTMRSACPRHEGRLTPSQGAPPGRSTTITMFHTPGGTPCGGAPCGGGRRTSWWGKAPHVGGLGARVGHAVVDYAVPCG